MRTWCSSPNGEGRCSTPLAPGGNIPIGLHRLRSGAEGIQRRTRPRTLAGQLSAEGARLSELMNSLKGVSSRRMKQEFPAISTFWRVRKSKGHLWSPSYFVGSVGGAPITILRQYIERSEEHTSE